MVGLVNYMFSATPAPPREDAPCGKVHMHHVRRSLLVMLCPLAAALSSVLAAQDFAAAYSVRGIYVPAPFISPTFAAATAPVIRWPLGYDRDDRHVAPGQNYLPEQLLVRDSVVRRWSDRSAAPVRVWIQSPRDIDGWDDAFPAMARQALEEWQTVELPVRFRYVADSSAAEIHILWTNRLGQDESGRTVWWSTPKGWIIRARVTLSTHASDGLPQTPRALRAVALHEIGHALGLGHTADARNIMAPWVEVTELSAADRNTAALLYQMQPGRVAASVADGAASAMQRRDRTARSTTPE